MCLIKNTLNLYLFEENDKYLMKWFQKKTYYTGWFKTCRFIFKYIYSTWRLNV